MLKNPWTEEAERQQLACSFKRWTCSEIQESRESPWCWSHFYNPEGDHMSLCQMQTSMIVWCAPTKHVTCCFNSCARSACSHRSSFYPFLFIVCHLFWNTNGPSWGNIDWRSLQTWTFLVVTKTTRWLQVGLDIADTRQHMSGSGQWCSTKCMWCWVLNWAKNLLWGNLWCLCLSVITRHQLISISEDEASLHKSKMI